MAGKLSHAYNKLIKLHVIAIYAHKYNSSLYPVILIINFEISKSEETEERSCGGSKIVVMTENCKIQCMPKVGMVGSILVQVHGFLSLLLAPLPPKFFGPGDVTFFKVYKCIH